MPAYEDFNRQPTWTSHSSPLRRQTSLVRPERERIDPNHRQYHTRRALAEFDASDRSSAPDQLFDMNSSVSTGRSILRSNLMERDDILHHQKEKQGVVDSVTSDKSCCTDMWKVFCYVVTCCCPPFALRAFGKTDKAAQFAFREKIGLVTIVLGIMAFVGFLTFGFTQTVCPRPPLSFRIDQINNGYVIIQGWAYMLASWNSHPTIPGMTDELTNPLYPPINAGGMDATFLFQHIQSGHCQDVIVAKGGAANGPYFPCRLFDPKSLDKPDNTPNANQSACHLSPETQVYINAMREYGVPNSQGGFDKAGRVYYDWSNVLQTKHLAVFNSNVLNLNLLYALQLDAYSVTPGGLIDSIMQNVTSFAGQDLTRTVTSRRNGYNLRKEAQCLTEIIKVGEIDTKSVGCIASDVVLYTSLIVILGVILVKFALAVVFGWFLSWKLGNFKEGRSYKERMKREAEIENWTSEIYRPAEAIRPQQGMVDPYSSKRYTAYSSKRRTLMPRTSRFTQPEPGSTHFKTFIDRPKSTLWRYSISSRGLGPFDPIADHYPLVRTYEYDKSHTSFRRPSDIGFSTRSSSVSSSSGFTHSTISGCPFPISRHAVVQPKANYMPFGFALAHTICLVTCYSEGHDGIRTTLDSIATTDYPNSHKLILVIADGIITGHGNDQSTPDICISMMRDFCIPPEEVEPFSYIAIADGSRRHNMAKVYAGFYKYDDNTVDPSKQQRVPMITIAKCGTPEESQDPKPGNRGKRDSQVILMSFLQKVMFDERMTMLEYEFFNNIWRVTGVSADKYEIVLMVDADTKVYPDALSRLVSCMVNDEEIMGLCGETKIGNKTDSWVSMIQVFEYYISHHQSKAFESIFGNVTCLPGCFCIYRIKSPKGPNGHWVPILANPDIIEHYSENVVDTLHKKNLLLLGEDRYLSTLMLRTFPRRKMLFVPQAVCKTVVPDSFRVLLSQRRRWINSTIHNLMELLFVSDMCGTFCFSMQFVVFMELVGTLALPAAISFTLYLIILAILGKPAIVSLILLALILGLPAVLIVMTSRKVVYVCWMIIYLFSLPIWNFVLPSYAYWHFDDFSWGETRKVQGSSGKDHHGDKEGEFDSSKIVMKKWQEFEKERRIRVAQEKANQLQKGRRQGSRNRHSGQYSFFPESLYDESFLGPQYLLSDSQFFDLPFIRPRSVNSDEQTDDDQDTADNTSDADGLDYLEWRILDTDLPLPRITGDEEEEDWQQSVLKSLAESHKKSSEASEALRSDGTDPEASTDDDDNDGEDNSTNSTNEGDDTASHAGGIVSERSSIPQEEQV